MCLKIMKMFDFNDVKVMIASGGGLGSWLTEIDLVLKVAISVASLIYIILKCLEILKGKDDRKGEGD